MTAIDRRPLLRAMFDAAIAAAQPARCLTAHLPAPPTGRTIVIGAGKASAAMACALEDNWDGPLEGLVVTRYGFDVIYIKAGFGFERDRATVQAVREAIGPAPRLRIDPNESWSPLQTKQMIARLAPYDLEFIEQPTPAEIIPALAQVRSTSPVGIAADQSVFTPDEAYAVIREQAADLIVIGPHECGGLARMTDIARIANLSGINICVHGLYESGITTCAAHMAAASCPNLDDGNQHMLKFLEWDIVKAPDLRLKAGRMPVLQGPGLGFTLDVENVAHAADLFKARQMSGAISE